MTSARALAIVLAAFLGGVLGLRAEPFGAMPEEAVRPPERVTTAAMAALPPHPRLLADADRWEGLRHQIARGGRHGELFAWLRQAGDALLAAPPINYAPGGPGENILRAMRETEHRVFTLAALYRLTDEPRYAQAAKAVLEGLASFPWPSTHYLDPSIACLTLGVGYDWLHETLSPDERVRYADKLRREAIEATLTNPAGFPFLWSDINWNQIGHAGLALGALATAEHHPEVARQVVNRAIALTPRVATVYGPDGAYPEGPGYWAFGTTFQVLQIEAYRTALGESYGLESFPGFLTSLSAIDQLTAPSGEIFNYFDNRPVRRAAAVAFWFARENGRADQVEAEWARLADQMRLGSVRDLCLALLWLPAPSDSSSPPTYGQRPLAWRAGGHQPVAVLRSSWDDPEAIWVAFKAGTPGYSHGHMDAGGFVIEAGGVRWSIDPVIEDYLVVRRRAGLSHHELFDTSQASQRWASFRMGPDGHSILRFDGLPQKVDGHGTMGEIEATEHGAFVTAELSALYRDQAVNVTRRIGLRTDGVVEFRDRWQLAERERTVVWQWITEADATVINGGRSVRLDQAGRTLMLTAEDTARGRFQIVDLSLPKGSAFDAPYPGLKRVELRLVAPAGVAGEVTVTARLESTDTKRR